MRIVGQLRGWLLAGWLSGVGFAACGQGLLTTMPPDFAPLLARLNQEDFDWKGRSIPLLPPPSIYRDSLLNPDKTREVQFELALADKPLGLAHRVVQLRGRGYPVSYSVVFEDCLVALFKNGRFGCYRLADFSRNERLEQQLDGGGGWQRHWLIDGQLIVQNAQRYYVFDPATRAWRPYEAVVPFGKQPKLYEDAKYLVYADCQGEFGGTAYFFNKQTQRTHRIGATCATSVWQEAGQYRLLASLGHMMGFANCVAIADPEALPLAPAFKKELTTQQLLEQASAKNSTSVFDFYALQLFGALRWHGQTLYLMHWRSTTFLVTIDGKKITIVDPLFANDLYTHNPITATYTPDLALTNLDFYGLGGSDEVATLLWQGQHLIKIEWGKQPSEEE